MNNTVEKNKNQTKKQTPAAWWQPSLVLFGKIVSWITGPIILALIFGKWLDNKYNSSPRYFLVCVAIGFVVTMLGLVKEAMEIGKDKQK